MSGLRVLFLFFFFFFFKQKTAYEMRISDWSSDVCSSDLGVASQSAAPDIRACVQPRQSRYRPVAIRRGQDGDDPPQPASQDDLSAQSLCQRCHAHPEPDPPLPGNAAHTVGRAPVAAKGIYTPLPRPGTAGPTGVAPAPFRHPTGPSGAA